MRRFLFAIGCLVAFFSSSLKAQNKMRINHLAIFVTDIKQSREFYVKVLGLDSIAEPFHDGKHLWLDLGFGASLHIIAGADKKIEHFLNNHICLSTPDFASFRNILEQRKIAWCNARGEKGKITTRTDGVLQLWLQDPDGYWIEINNDKKTLGGK